MNTRGRDIADWLRRQMAAAGARGLAVGLSGGVDAAVVARLCQMAAPANVVGVILPCHGDPQDEADAFLAANHFAIPTLRADLTPAYDHLLYDLEAVFAQLPAGHVPARGAADGRNRVPLAELQPRMRMAALHFVAGSLGYLIAGTLNRSDLTISRFTRYGESGVDLLPLGSLMHGEVRALALALDVPAAIVDRPGGARVQAGRADEAELGFGYADLENYLINGPDLVAPALAMRIERLVRSSEHKRALPPMPDENAKL